VRVRPVSLFPRCSRVLTPYIGTAPDAAYQVNRTLVLDCVRERRLTPPISSHTLLFKALHIFKPKDPWDQSERSRILWIHKTLNRICNLCAPSLLSLTVSFGPTEQPQPHWTWGTHHFPLLREFTFIYFDRKQQSGLPKIDYANMPMLKTLWISALPRLGALDMIEFNTQLTLTNGIPKRRIPRLVFEVGPDSWMESFVYNYYGAYLDTPRTDSHSWIFDTVEHHAIMPDRDYQIGIIWAVGRTGGIGRADGIRKRASEGVHLPGNVSLYTSFFVSMYCPDTSSFRFSIKIRCQTRNY
jgi:hypothetical protein